MLIALIAAVVFALDYVSKRYIATHMTPGQSIPVVGRYLHITYVRNAGAAFGMLQHQTLFFILVSLVVVGLIVSYGRTAARGDVWLSIALGLLLGGALGNLLDRLLYGTVIDFIDFRVWPVFNLADSAITLGGIIFVVLLLQRDRRERSGKAGDG